MVRTHGCQPCSRGSIPRVGAGAKWHRHDGTSLALLAQIPGLWINAWKQITDNIEIDPVLDQTADPESDAIWAEFNEAAKVPALA